MIRHHKDPVIDQAIWEGGVAKLQELAPCRCCCAEHTFGASCPAFSWGGCRGQHSDPPEDFEAWARHYGMTVEEFTRLGNPASEEK